MRNFMAQLYVHRSKCFILKQESEIVINYPLAGRKKTLALTCVFDI